MNVFSREGNLDYTVVAASGEEMGIRKVIAHSGDPKDWNNNLALVFLERSLQLGAGVDIVCLFSPNVTRDCFGYNLTHAFGNTSMILIDKSKQSYLISCYFRRERRGNQCIRSITYGN